MTRQMVESATLFAYGKSCDPICCLYPGYGNSDLMLPRTLFGELTVGSVSCEGDCIILPNFNALGIHLVVVLNTDSHQEYSWPIIHVFQEGCACADSLCVNSVLYFLAGWG